MSFLYPNFLKSTVLILFFYLLPSSLVFAKSDNSVRRSKLSLRDTSKGVIVDGNGKPVVNAQVKLSGKSVVVSSGTDGSFAIIAMPGDRLIISHAGFYRKETTVKNHALNIRLTEIYLSDADSVDVLYGRKAISSLTGPVATINSNQLTSAPTQSILPALAGRLAGLNISQTSGYPGTDGDGQALTGSISASIRGYQGKTVSGNDLIVSIDGSIRPYFSIAPEEIESVTLLKDAVSTAMFGQRSTPGMLLITTKKGQAGATRMTFSYQTAVQTPLAFPQPLGAFDYANLYDQTQINNGIAPANVKYSATALNAYQTGSDPYLYPNVDWKNTILKSSTTQNKYNFNIQGSGAILRYFISLDYLKDNALFNTADFNSYNTSPDYSRYSLRSNVGVDFNKTLTLNVGLYARVQDQTEPGNRDAQGILAGIFTTPALAYPISNPNGTYGGNSAYQTNLYARSVQDGYSLYNTKDLSFDLSLTQKLDKFLPGLYVKAGGNVNVSNQYLTDRHKSYAVVPITAGPGGVGYTYGTAIGTNTDIPNPVTVQNSASQYRQTSTYIEGLAGYDHNFGPNALSIKLVANEQSTVRNEDLPYIYNTFGANASYNYRQKYFAEVAGSYGSFNQFSPSHQYEPFYAAGIAWNVAKENIIKDNISWISNLKLRANYGKTGYVNRGSYAYFAYIQRYQATGSYYFFGSSATGSSGFGEAGLANPEAEGEKAKKLDVGIDLGFFKNHLSISADIYNNDLYDIWALPGGTFQVLGNGITQANIGKQNYSGYEFTASYKNNIGNFNYFGSLNVSVAKSKNVYSAEINYPNAYQFTTGLPVGIFSGYTAVGLFRSQAEIDASAVPNSGGITRANIKPGDIKYLDRNNDGVIDASDVGPVGTTAPQVVYGVTLGFSFKGVDFNMLIQGIQNRQVYLSGDYEWAFRNNGLNTAFQQNLNAYSATNPTATYPRLTIGSNPNNELTSTFWLHNAGFARLKNAEIGYTFPHEWTSRLRIPSARVYVNGENLITVSQLNDFGVKVDPEVQGATYPLQRIVNFGVTIKL